MGSKKHIPKYTLYLLLYISICLLLLLVRINRSIRAKSVAHESRNFSHPASPTMDPVIDASETPINAQKIESSLQKIAMVCEKYNKTTSLERTHFFHAPTHNALFCWIRKVASSSFTKFFAELRGIVIQRNYYKESAALSPVSIEEFLNLIDDMGVFKFLAVRHPFERLVSTYRSRIEDNSKYSDQAWIYAPRIFHLTRPELFHFNETVPSPMQRIFYNNRRLKLVPSFEEFVLWLLSQPEDNDDEHWSQYHSHCSICQMNFDYVLKVDDVYIHEFRHIFTKLNSKAMRWNLRKVGQTRGGATNFHRTCNYLSTLTTATLKKLYERYRVDFEMFDYNVSAYEACRKIEEK